MSRWKLVNEYYEQNEYKLLQMYSQLKEFFFVSQEDLSVFLGEFCIIIFNAFIETDIQIKF